MNMIRGISIRLAVSLGPTPAMAKANHRDTGINGQIKSNGFKTFLVSAITHIGMYSRTVAIMIIVTTWKIKCSFIIQ